MTLCDEWGAQCCVFYLLPEQGNEKIFFPMRIELKTSSLESEACRSATTAPLYRYFYNNSKYFIKLIINNNIESVSEFTRKVIIIYQVS